MLRALVCCCALLAVTPRPAAAEWHFIPSVGLTFAGKTSLIDLEQATDNVHRNIGGTVTLLGHGIFGVESVFVYTPGFFQMSDDIDTSLVTSSRTIAFMGNAVLTTPRRWTEYGLRPFVSGGLGVLRTSVTDRGNIFSTDTDRGCVQHRRRRRRLFLPPRRRPLRLPLLREPAPQRAYSAHGLRPRPHQLHDDVRRVGHSTVGMRSRGRGQIQI